MNILAVDPGINGALAYTDKNNQVIVEKMPLGMTAICDRFKVLTKQIDQCYIEKIMTPHRKGNSAASSVKFGRNCGHIEAALYCAGIKTQEVPAGTWQRRLGVLPKDYSQKKRAIKEIMARHYPSIKVIEQVADALAIFDWAENKGK